VDARKAKLWTSLGPGNDANQSLEDVSRHLQPSTLSLICLSTTLQHLAYRAQLIFFLWELST
jgi:hypothetical protein